MAKPSSISVVLPVFNPPAGWAEQCLAHKAALESELEVPVSLIVVDDGSDATDEFGKLTEGVEVIHLGKNQGKGAALRAGFQSITEGLTIFTDADFPYQMKSMKAIVEALQHGADVALGYREQDYYASVPWFRKGLSEAFRFVLRDVLSFPITDTQCGLKGMNEAGLKIFLETEINRFLVDMEFIKRASRAENLRVEPVVVHLRDNVKFSSMGVGVLLPELFNFIRIILR